MKVLSLFDGMSCGQIALKELKMHCTEYYASEIDKHAIRQTQVNFPNTVQLGDVCLLRKAMTWKDNIFEKAISSVWLSKNTKKRIAMIRSIDWASIRLILAGSPCQGFSFAGRQLAFNDPRSKLFFEFVRILNHVKSLNPKVFFLLENVNMKREYMRVISEALGVFPVNINSNLVSAQNRNRWYWTNIRTRMVGLFGDIHSDIPQPEDRGVFLKDIIDFDAVVDDRYYLSQTMVNHVINPKRLKKKWSQLNGEKALPLLARGSNNGNGDFIIAGDKIRRLTTGECAKLQTIPRWYKWIVSDTQIYRLLGNGWTIDVIKHIISFLPEKSKQHR